MVEFPIAIQIKHTVRISFPITKNGFASNGDQQFRYNKFNKVILRKSHIKMKYQFKVTYPNTYKSAGSLTSSKLSISKLSGGILPPTFQVVTQILLVEISIEPDLHNLINLNQADDLTIGIYRSSLF